MSSNSNLKITVSNCWSYYNKGDAAITSATVELFQKVFPSVKLTVLSFDPESFNENKSALDDSVEVLPMPTIKDSLTPLRKLFEIVSLLKLQNLFGPLFLFLIVVLIQPLRRFDKNIDSVIRSIDDSSMLVVVGGNYLYSHSGFYVHAIPIIYAKFIRKKKIVLLGHSVGPFEDFSSRFISSLILRNTDLVIFRENISKSYVEDDLSVYLTNKLVACDMALFLQPSENETKIAPISRRIAITVRPWLFKDDNLNRRYIDSVTQTAIHFIEKEKFQVYLIPFSTIKGQENDYVPCSKIYGEIYRKHPESIQLLEVSQQSPESLLNTMNRLELSILIGTRFHSVIFASVIGVPSVIISYQHFKAQGISRMLGLSGYVINIEDIDSVQLKTLVAKLISNNKEERKKLIENVNALRTRNKLRISKLLSSLMAA
jgi:colanic acid/amylovoran biosynthesis protein